MKKHTIFLLFCFLVFQLFSFSIVRAQYGTITNVVGSGCLGSYSGDGGSATSSGVCFKGIRAVTLDTAGDIFILDWMNNRIRKVYASTGIITTIAGNGTRGYSGDGGPGPLAKMGVAYHLCVDRVGNCYYADYDSHRIRKIDHSTGIISTVVGNGSTSYSGDGGAATAAGIGECTSVYVDHGGNLYFGDIARIRKVNASSGIVTTIAGTGTHSSGLGDGGPAVYANVGSAWSIVGDASGNIYFDDDGNARVRKISTSGIITTIAGGGSAYGEGCPATSVVIRGGDLGIDSAGNIYLADYLALERVTASTGIINKIGSCDGGIYVDPTGAIYYPSGGYVVKLTGASSGINIFSPSDTIITASCSTPATVGLRLYGLINGTPSSTDSMDIYVNYGNHSCDSSNVRRNYRLPYWYAAGSYGFGSLTTIVDTFTYDLPGPHTPTMDIYALSGYTERNTLAPITTVSSCSSSLSLPIYFDFSASSLNLVTSPCVFPAVASFTFTGQCYESPSFTDSVYIIIDFGDGTTEHHLLPFTGTTCVYSGSHTFLSSGTYTLNVKYITSNGIESTPTGPTLNLVDCYGGSIYSSVTVSHSSSGCSLPDTVTYHYSGYVSDSATMAANASVYVSYGDGSTDLFSVPISLNMYGTYVVDTYFSHVFSMPGVYTSYHLDSVGSYNYWDMFNYGTYPSELVLGTSCVTASGIFYIDSNANCIKDTSEAALGYWPYALINNTVGDSTFGWCDAGGRYSLSVITGYSYTLVSHPFGYFSAYGRAGATLSPSCPSSGIYTFTATTGTTYTHDFAFTCSPPSTMDMSVSGWGWAFVPGDTGAIGIWSSNAWGYICDTLSTDIYLIKDHRLSYAGMWSGPAPSAISGDSLKWHIASSSSLFEFEGIVKVVTSTSSTIYDTLHNTLYVSPTRISDAILANNTYSWSNPVISSWDPNELQVSPQGIGLQGFIPNATPLSYMVHFQNSGSAAARNITLVDTLNSNLDISTLQVIGSASPVLIYQVAPNVIKFRFNDIYLPDSMDDPTGSIGFLSFNISPNDSLPGGTQITNSVSIFFDYNPPVVTNTTLNTIGDTIGQIYGPDSVCIGASISLFNHIFGGVWTSRNGHASVSGGIVTGISPGLDTITYNVYGGQSVTKIVNISGSAVTAITGSSTVCTGASTTLSASISGGSWSTTGSGIVSVSSSGAVSGIAVGTDTVLYTSTATCGSGIARMPILVTTTPSIGTITSGSSVCVGSSITLAATGATGGTWTSSNTSGTISGTSLSGVSAGIDTVMYSLSNTCGTSSVSASVTINPLPAAGTMSGSSSVCVGSTTTITSSASGGSWSASNASASVSGGVVTGAVAGTDTISYTVTNGCGSSVASTVLTVNPLPVAGSLSGASAVCVGASITLTPSVTGGSWSVSGSAASVSGGIVSGIGAGTDTISYTVSNGCGSAVAHAVVTVNPLPSAGTISGGSTVCAGTSFTLTTSISGGSWSASGSAATVSGGVVSGVSAGTDTIFYSISNTCGTDVAHTVITVNPLPVAGTLSGGSTVCAGSTTTVTASVSGGTWTSSSAAFATVSGGVVTGVSAGVDSVFYTVSNSCGSDIIFRLVTVNPLPVAGTLSAGSSVCVGATLTLTPSISGGSWRSGSAGFATVSGGVVTGVTAGIDSIFYSVTNSCGTDIIYRLLTVNPLPSAGVLSGVDSVCIGATSTLSSSSAGGAWSTTTVAVATVSLGGVVTGISAGMTRIYYIQTNSCGADTVWTNFIVKSLPVAGTISGTDSICAGSSVTLTTTGTGGIWLSSNSAVTTVLAGSVTGVSAGVDTILYIVANSCGIDSDRFTFTVLTAPATTTVSGFSNVCVGDTIQLSAAMAGGVWTSSSSAATISGSGVVTGVTAGSTTISYAVANLCGTTYSTFAVTVNPIPSAGTIVGVDTICLGMAFHFTDAAGSGTWSSSNSAIATVSGSGIVRGLSTGTVVISYTVTSICGTISATRTMFVRAASDCPEEVKSIGNQSGNDFAIFPNPSSGTFNIELPTHEGNVSISVTDVHGKVVKTLLVSDNKQLQIPIDMTNYAAGVYLIKAEVDGKIWRKKVVVM